MKNLVKNHAHSKLSVDPKSQPNYMTKFHNKSSVVTYDSCFGINPQFDGMDHACIFPFIYRGIVSIAFYSIKNPILIYMLFLWFFNFKKNCVQCCASCALSFDGRKVQTNSIWRNHVVWDTVRLISSIWKFFICIWNF